MITSSSAFAKGVRVPDDALHLCYCYTPMRWAWSFDRYVDLSAMSSSARMAAKLTLPALRRWDTSTSRGVDRFVAISTEVVAAHPRHLRPRQRRSSFLPVDVKRFRARSTRRRLLPRRVAAQRLQAHRPRRARLHRRSALPLVVVGAGPEREALEAIAGPTVRFAGRLTDRETTSMFERCRALILPGEEDFGLTPLEANAAGRPVVAFARGGALDTVRDGETGVLFHDATTESLEEALRTVQEQRWNPARSARTPRRSPRTSSSPASAPSSPPRWSRRSWDAWAPTTQHDAAVDADLHALR